MRPICKNCQYWNLKKVSNGMEYLIYGKYYIGSCSCEKFVYMGGDDAKLPKDGLGYADYECYSASFTTGEEFGCIHFEPKKK